MRRARRSSRCKSLKLYLGSFRNHCGFHEDVTVGIGQRLFDEMKPAVAAHRRLLVSARRHPDRRLLAVGRAARRAVGARPGGRSPTAAAASHGRPRLDRLARAAARPARTSPSSTRPCSCPASRATPPPNSTPPTSPARASSISRRCPTRDHPAPHMLPGAAAFGAAMAALGVGRDDRIVVYDNSPLRSATRGWFMLRHFGADRVAILDGGLAKWRAEGRPVEAGRRRARATPASTRSSAATIVDQGRCSPRGADGPILDARGTRPLRGQRARSAPRRRRRPHPRRAQPAVRRRSTATTARSSPTSALRRRIRRRGGRSAVSRSSPPAARA